MNRSKVKSVECNLKQTDIFTVIENWKAMKKEKDMKKRALADIIIEIDDSDAEEAVNILPNRKRPLAEPFSDDDEKTDISPLPLREIETNAVPKMKRSLRYSFFEDDIKNSKTELTETTTPTKNTNNNGIMHPVACSTPLCSQESCISSSLNSLHIGIKDILDISAIDGKTDDGNSDIDSDKTIIMPENPVHNDTTVQVSQRLLDSLPFRPGIEKNSSAPEPPTSPNKMIEVRQNIVIQPPSVPDNSTSDPIINSESHNGTKRHREEEKLTKKQKTNHPQKNNITTEKRWLSEKDSTIENGTKQQKTENQNSPAGSGKATPKNQNTNGEGKTHQATKNENLAAKEVGSDNNNNKSTAKKDSNSQHADKGSPEKNPSVSAIKTSPNKTIRGKRSRNSLDLSVKSPKVKNEKTMNKEALELITNLLKGIFSSRLVSNVSDAEKGIIRMFLDMSVSYRYAAFKLIMWKRRWYNAYKFCKLIHLDLEETEIAEMVNTFERHGFIDTDYRKETPGQLLPRLDNTNLRGICDKFKLKKTLKTKEDMIGYLLKYADTQTTLTRHKTTRDLLLEEIQRRMGRCMRVSEDFLAAFHSVYLLATFTNPNFVTINEYLNKIQGQKVVFPQFSIDEYVIFSSRMDFLSFAKARRYRNNLEESNDPVELLQICKTIFKELRALESAESDDGRFEDAPHLARFTAKGVYVSALSSMAQRLYCKFPKEVRAWLEYLIRKVEWPHKVGHWYFHLVWLYMRHLHPPNYSKAADLLVEVLHRKRDHLSEVQLYHLRKRGEQLFSTKKYKLEQMHHDLIVQLLPDRIKVRDIPQTSVDAKAMRSNDLGLKRNYEVRDREGNRTYLRVEEIALDHYLTELGYTGGQHCEGALVKATFTLFFFDIIYNKNRSIPGTFISDLQSEPLDMNSRYFYRNRKEEIDRRVKEIESEWSDDRLLGFLKENYDAHSHEFTLCEVGHIIPEAWLLEVLVDCIGRRVLAKIYERLAKNFREYRSGLPDLLVWNVDGKQSKFVEVKGENDELSIGQTLWLDYLRRIGANVEVCHVHSMGSKRKLKKVAGIDEQPSTSSAG